MNHLVSQKTYLVVFIALMLLLGATVSVGFVNLGPFNLIVAMAISISKGLLIVLFFMQVRYSSRLTWIFAASGFFWLLTLIVLSMADYFTRSWTFRGGG